MSPGRHLCGINMYSNVPENEYLRYEILAEMTPYGIIANYKEGIRSSDASINQMWLILDNVPQYIQDEMATNNNKRLAVADTLQARYNVPVHQTTLRNVRHIINARSGRIKI